MKNLIFIGLALFSFSFMSAQIPNGNFETTLFDIKATNVDKWGVVGNQEQIDLGNGKLALKVSNSLNAALIISDEKSTDPNTADYYSISARPDSLKLWIQYDLKGTDTLMILTKNEEMNNAFGYALRKLTGARSGWNPLTLKIDYTSPGFADSALVAVYIKSANPSANASWFAIESIKFVNISGNEVANIPNKNFDDWQGDSIAYPQFWTTSALINRRMNNVKDQDNSQISMLAASGIQSVLLETNSTNGTANGEAHSIPYDSFTASLDLTNTKPGFTVSQRYTYLKGKYQFTQMGSDSGVIQVVMFEKGKEVSHDNIIFNQSTTMPGFQDFLIPIYYPGFSGTPDACLISMYSSHPNMNNLTSGTSLWVDALSFTKEVNSIHSINSSPFSVYPNPSSGIMKIESDNIIISAVSVLDLGGKSILKRQGNIRSLNLNNLTCGSYILKIESQGKIYTQLINLQ